MRIGIVSDSHGKSDRLARGIGLLKDSLTDVIVHCGDIENADGIKLLADSNLPSYLAAGNMDISNFLRLQTAADSCGVIFATDFVTVPLDDGDGDGANKKYLAATHGKDQLLLDELILGRQYRYVCHGHTHQMSDECVNSTRVLNPGALFHPRVGGRTVMLLDTDTDTVKIIEVE